MKLKIKEKWVKALRSGKYKQAKGYLLKREGGLSNKGKKIGYCCLGVLTDLYCKERGYKFDNITKRHGNAVLPDTVAKWAGLSNSNPQIGVRDASELNDKDNKTFPQIAKLIDKHL